MKGNDMNYTIVTNESVAPACASSDDLKLADELVKDLREWNISKGYIPSDSPEWKASELDVQTVAEWRDDYSDAEIWTVLTVVKSRFDRSKKRDTTNKQALYLSYINDGVWRVIK